MTSIEKDIFSVFRNICSVVKFLLFLVIKHLFILRGFCSKFVEPYRVPVIFLTVIDAVEVRETIDQMEEECRKRTVVLTKPIFPSALVSEVSRLLGHSG